MQLPINLQILADVPLVHIGFSGGLDSTVLLHYLQSNKVSIGIKQIKAIHINHNISANACSWQNHCQKLCDDYAIELLTTTLDLAKNTTETQARKARYQAFNSLITNNTKHDSVLVLAHHSNDNIETMLLNIITGASIDTIVGIPSKRYFNNIKLLRPLLNLTKLQLRQYAVAHKLVWVEDDSNSNLKHQRNFVRKQLLPQINAKFKNSNLELTQLLLGQDKKLIAYFVELEIKQLQQRREIFGYSISLIKLLQRPNFVITKVLHYWLHKYVDTKISNAQSRQLLQDLTSKSTTLNISFGLWQLRYFQNRLYLLKLPPTNIDKASVTFNSEVTEQYLTIKSANNTQKSLLLAPKADGIRCKPLFRNQSQKLKKLLQEYNVPTHLRPYLALVYSTDNKLLAVAGVFICCKSVADLVFTYKY